VGAYVLTNANGGFSLTGDYACSSGQQLYLYALGGNAGSGVNSAIGLMAAIGSCPSASGPAVVATVNEVSTVAAAYAMAGFATDAMHVSSSGTALAQVGVANAFANAGNLVTLATGVALATTPAGNGAVPQAEINTLANVLASCVNASASCDTLFATATADGTTTGTKATDTASAAINIVHSPGANVAALYGLATGITTFGPALTAQPNDFTIAINFAGVGPYGIVGITIDGSGDVWIEYSPGNALIKFSSSGAAISGPNGYPAGGLNNSDYGVAIDRSGNVWAANVNSGTISEFTSSGTQISGSGGYIGGGLVSPYSLAIDGLGNLWAVNRTNLSELNSLGAAISGTSGYTGGGLNVDPGVIAIDGSGNVWVTNYYNSLAKFGPSGAAISGSSGYTGGGLSDPLGIAIDGSGNVWIANASGGGIIKFNSSGISVSGPSGYTGGGLNVPYGIAVDGSGDIWVTNASGNSISAFNSSGIAISGSSGYTRSGLNGPRGIALDGSGNVWVTSGGGVVEFIGVATPVITPICAGLPATPTTDGTSKLGTRP
jgi:streptogramin lyase